MKKFILLLLIFNSCLAYSFENISIPQNALNQNEYRTPDDSVISNAEIDVLEKKIFKKIFRNDSQIARIERLEKEIFGMVQNGGAEDRFDNLVTASDYYLSGYKPSENIKEKKYKLSQKQNTNSKYYDTDTFHKKPSKVMQFLSDIADILSSGIVTGYTIPVDSLDIDIPDTINTFGGTSYLGVPQYSTYYSTPYVNPSRYIRPYNPYVTRYRHNYVPPRYNYYKKPSGVGINNYTTGSGVKIIY